MGKSEDRVGSPAFSGSFCRSLFALAVVLAVSGDARASEPVRLVTDRTTYNVGEEVFVRAVVTDAKAAPPEPVGTALRSYRATIRYLGETGTSVADVPLPTTLFTQSKEEPQDYVSVWKIPGSARTGRYEIQVRESADPVPSGEQRPLNFARVPAVTFAVYRKLVRIERLELGKTFYTPGDAVACRVVIHNLTGQKLNDLRVEFSDRYWPWIGNPSPESVHAVPIAESLSLAAGEKGEVESAKAAIARTVLQPSTRQFAVVVWEHDRKNVLDIAFSSLVFVQPPGVEIPKPYPGQFIYPNLGAVNTTSYREFYAGELHSDLIHFDRSHTMYRAGEKATVKFWVEPPAVESLPQVNISVSLRALDRAEFQRKVVAEKMDINSRRGPFEATLELPVDGSGNYRAVVEVREAAGELIASSSLELAANALPQSILIFCAHEDDEGTQMGLIRAATESNIPIHIVYFTSGDAGSCDRYYEHSCTPPEALNFGALRMEEARAALGHLGVARDDVLFLGLPDGGSGKIWYEHVKADDPYLSVLLASDHSPYEGLFKPNLPYARGAAVNAVKEIIRKFQPQAIVTVHPPAEGHIDHIVSNYFVVEAMQQLLREGALSPKVELRVDPIFDPKAHQLTPYHYDERVLAVSGEAAALAQEAGWFYQSQGGNRAQGNLRAFSQLPRTQKYRLVLDWNEHQGWNEKD